jgi:hypothetical protein
MARKQGFKSFEDGYEYFQRRVHERINSGKRRREVKVNYEAFGCDGNGIPMDNLGDVAFKGKIRFHERRGRTQVWKSKLVENPTWLDVSVLANDMLLATGEPNYINLQSIVVTIDGFPTQTGEFFMAN